MAQEYKLSFTAYEIDEKLGKINQLDERIVELEDNATIIDETLTEHGAAADAKAVGDALAEKQPKGNYLNHSELSGAINTALTQAKESGEFDGKDGYTPYVTPQMFGAVADGATDDTVAV